MPGEENTLNVLILHHPDDDHVAVAGRKGEVSEFKHYLSMALGRAKMDIRLDRDFLAGTEKEKEIEEFAKRSHLVVFVFSVSFFHRDEPFYVQQFESINGKQRPHAVLYLSTCPYEDVVAIECGIFPSKTTAVDCAALRTTAFSDAAKAIANLIKDLPSAVAKPSPEFTFHQKSLLLDALLDLNYTEQNSLFQDCISAFSKPRPAALLVHGLLRHDGAVWLISRLLRMLQDKNIHPWKYDASSAEGLIHFDTNGFLGPLTERLGLPLSASYTDIRKAMFAQMQQDSRTFIVQITGVRDFLESSTVKAFSDFKSEFWDPLIQDVEQAAQPANAEPKLFFFFVADRDMDHCDHFCEFDSAVQAQLVRLQKVKPFELTELSTWAVQKLPVLKSIQFSPATKLILQKKDREERVTEIHQKSQNGWPEKVLQFICAEFGCRFSDMIQMLPAHETKD